MTIFCISCIRGSGGQGAVAPSSGSVSPLSGINFTPVGELFTKNSVLIRKLVRIVQQEPNGRWGKGVCHFRYEPLRLRYFAPQRMNLLLWYSKLTSIRFNAMDINAIPIDAGECGSMML